jgi:deazaflavin-dependent oxidoreductase (nitroreductase family)
VDKQSRRQRFFWVLAHTINPAAMAAARSGRGPFSLVRHVGRKSGRSYETPLIVAPHPDGFVAELTYGPNVSWYRNTVAAGHCVLIVGGTEYEIDGVTELSRQDGLRAFGFARALVLKVLRRKEFRLLHVAGGSVSELPEASD